MNGPLTGWQGQLDAWLAALQQMRIPGGCEDCHAFHTV